MVAIFRERGITRNEIADCAAVLENLGCGETNYSSGREWVTFERRTCSCVTEVIVTHDRVSNEQRWAFDATFTPSRAIGITILGLEHNKHRSSLRRRTGQSRSNYIWSWQITSINSAISIYSTVEKLFRKEKLTATMWWICWIQRQRKLRNTLR